MQVPIEEQGGEKAPGAPFPGSQEERDALVQALSRACTCGSQTGQHDGPPCAAHRVLSDPDGLKRLVFYRRWHLALRRAEWLNDPRWAEPGLTLDPGIS